MKTVPSVSGVRFTPDDRRLLALLRKRLGLGIAQLIRLGLRALAAKEGIYEK